MTATRCAIGVTPPSPFAVEAACLAAGNGALASGLPLPQAASASAISSGAPSDRTLILGSRARNPR